MNKIVGALWEKEKDGQIYYSGVLQDLRGNVNIAVFPNNYKNAPNQPDFNIVISFGDKPEKADVSTPAKKNGKKKEKEKVDNSEEPPF